MIRKFPILPTLALGVAAFLTNASAQTTGFNKATAGPWDYDDTANWVGGTINGIWDSSLTLTAAQTVTFDSNLMLTTGLNFGYTGNQALTLRGDGTNRTITLGGNITVNTGTNPTVTLGSTTGGQNLNVNLGGDRTFSIASGKSLRFYNGISGGNLIVNGNNSATIGGGTAILSGDTAVAATSAISLTRGALLSFDSSTSGSTGATRAQSLQLGGGALSVTGNTGVNSTETIAGALTIAPGYGFNSITLSPGAGTHIQLNAGSLGRSGTGAVLFRGTGLGVNSIASATANSSNIAFSTSPSAQLVGGALGTKGAGILPWAVVDTSATGLGSSFATYDATNGIRALNASEFSTAIATDGSTNGHNIKLTATGSPFTVNGATTINSLFVDAGATGAHTVLDGTSSLTITSGAVFFNIASMTGANGAAINVAKNLDFGTTQGVIGTSASANQRRVTFTGGLSGSGGLVFYDTGLNTNQATGFYLATANTYTGNTYINGTVSVAANNALANFSNNSRTGDVYLNGVLKLITTNGTVQINGLWGDGTVYSQYSNSNKTLAVGDNNATSTFGGNIQVDGGTGSVNLRKVGTGTLTLTGTSSNFTGLTAVQNGTLEAVTLNNIAAPNASSSLGRPTSVAGGTIGLGNSTTTGRLKVTGTGETTDRVINLVGTTGGAAIEQAGSGTLKFTSDFTATGNGIKTLTLDGSTAGVGEIAGAIVNSSGATSLTKNGTGTWKLAGVNTYTGATVVNAGTLLIYGSLAAGSAVSLNAAILGGSGTASGLVTTAGITSTISPGNSPGTLTLAGGLNATAGATFVFELGTTSDVLSLGSGVLTGSSAAGGMVFNFSDSGGLLASNPYTIMTFGSSSGLDYTDFVASILPSGYVLDTNFGTGGFQINGTDLQVQFDVVPEPGTVVLLAGGLMTVFFFRRRRS